MKTMILSYSSNTANFANLCVFADRIPEESISRSDGWDSSDRKSPYTLGLLPKEQLLNSRESPDGLFIGDRLLEPEHPREGVCARHSVRGWLPHVRGHSACAPPAEGAALTRPGHVYGGSWENTQEGDRKRKGREGGQLPAVTKHATLMAKLHLVFKNIYRRQK